MSFPKGFVWGAAAAAFQVEGATSEDGRGFSVWDAFCRREGAVYSGHTGEVACDHYHRWEDDIELMKGLDLQAYRFSISWTRVLPLGTGSVNEKGLAFYDRLIDGLLDAGITPHITLFHWDYPYELYCRGGWLNPESPEWFAQYTRIVADRFGDRVKNWMTLNEPQCYLTLGHRDGVHAPGLKLPWMDVLRATHHSLMAHGRAVQVLRERCKLTPTIGWAPVGEVIYPISDQPADIAVARQQTFAADQKNLWNNTLFSDPILLGHYPEDALRTWGDDFPKFTQRDLDTIHQKIDFYGLNIYRGKAVRSGPTGKAELVNPEPGNPINAFHWNITPPALYWGPRFIHERYKLPIIITENGFAGLDWVSQSGKVQDPQRIDFCRQYLHALGRAIDDGADVRGYFYWSLMDNFEWNEGYRQRFGLVHINYETQERTPKESAWWYASVIRSNGRDLNGPPELELHAPPAKYRRGVSAVDGRSSGPRATQPVPRM